MKRITAMVLSVFLCGLVSAAGKPADFLERFGISAEEAQVYALNALDSGVVPYEILAGAFKEMPVGERIAMVHSFVAWAKSFARTEGFRKAYQAWREEKKPHTDPGSSTESQMQNQRTEFQKMIDEMKKALPQLPAEQRKEMEKTIAELIKQRQEMEKDQELQTAMKQGLAEEQKRMQAEHQAGLKEWENRFPADLNRLLARRLKSFLDLSATVDFAAKLRENGEQKLFVNETYEAKPPEWKLCFRAGKEVIQAARADVVTWLKEIEGK